MYKGLKDNPSVILKVLVGLNVDKTLYGIIEHGSNERGFSDEERGFIDILPLLRIPSTQKILTTKSSMNR